jgi:dipeptidyl aminopeptidase/acylaminoacyl peptidase
MVKALKKANKEVKYKVFSRESHYIAYWKNRFRLYQDIETFLGKHLGGRKISMDAL